MDELTKNNLIALLEECYLNGRCNAGALFAWFNSVYPEIRDVLNEIRAEEGKELYK
jgi:hypothetical protein